jgi:hypothetical protein
MVFKEKKEVTNEETQTDAQLDDFAQFDDILA